MAVAIGLRTATGGSVTGIEETSLRALAKLEQVLPPRLRSQVNTLQTYTLHIRHRRRTERRPRDPVRCSPRPAATTRGLRFDYADRRGEPTQRRTEPYRLVNWDQRWYLVAWDIDRADWRTFRVDRMRPGMSIGARFAPRPLTDADVEGLMSRGSKPFARRFQARVIVHTSAADLAARIGPWVGTVTAVDDASCILETGADSLESLAVYLGLLGTDFTVTSRPSWSTGSRPWASGTRGRPEQRQRSRDLEVAPTDPPPAGGT